MSIKRILLLKINNNNNNNNNNKSGGSTHRCGFQVLKFQIEIEFGNVAF